MLDIFSGMDNHSPMIIEDLLDKLDLTQTQLAKELNVSSQRINHYIHRRREIPLYFARELIKYAKSYGIKLTLEDIYGDSHE